MKSHYKIPSLKFFVVLLFVLSSFASQAGHIVGGYLSYTCLDSNRYIIKMRIYRDSLGSGTPYRDPAVLNIVDLTTNTLFTTWAIDKGPTKLIPIDTAIGCTTAIPPTILIQYVDYIDTVYIPPSAGGYRIDHSVCCRNQAITNITNPQGYASNWQVTIPPNDTTCNSTPVFTENPPIVLCNNRPINLPIEVTEPDGDSLHYEICQLLSNPTTQIPYDFLIPSSPGVYIEPATGVLRGTPNQIGQYVLGICVREYRNGTLLSTAQLDYQFNVSNCISVYSDIVTQFEDSVNACSGLSITFTDESQNATDVFWDFSDTTTLADTSSLRNPTYTYPAPGRYTVQLIAEKGDTCTDTTSSVFEVQLKDSVSFTQQGEYCFANNSIQFIPTGNFTDSTTFLWKFGPNANIDTSQKEIPPPISWNSPGKYYVVFEATTGFCTLEYSDTVTIKPGVVSDMLLPSEDPSIVCNGLEVNFISESTNATSLFWNFGDPSTLADTSELDSTAYTFPQAGTYNVRLIAYQDTTCVDSTTHRFEVHEKLEPLIRTSGVSCFEGQSLHFEAIGNYPASTEFSWFFGPLASVPVKDGKYALEMFWTEPGIYPVELTARTTYCTEVVYDTVEIRALSLQVDAGDTQRVDLGQPINLTASEGAEYYWSADEPVKISSPWTQSTIVDVTSPEDSIIKFYVVVTDGRGCQGIDSTYVIIEKPAPELAYNFISPNEDGVNDYLDLSEMMNGEDCALHVLNRWGSEVYEAETYNNDWFGTDLDGNPLPDGTYYFILHYPSGEKFTGPVSIVRSN